MAAAADAAAEVSRVRVSGAAAAAAAAAAEAVARRTASAPEVVEEVEGGRGGVGARVRAWRVEAEGRYGGHGSGVGGGDDDGVLMLGAPGTSPKAECQGRGVGQRHQCP